MSTTVAVDPRYTRGHAVPSRATPEMKQYTLLAVQEGSQWASLCPELDIASCGDTAEEALDMLQRAVADALEYERDTGVGAGAPVPPSALALFLGEAQPQKRIITL